MTRLLRKREICQLCTEKGNSLISRGLEFAKNGMPEAYQNRSVLKEECAVNARYLHRGYYCPSPFWDLVISNARRGKLIKHPNKRSKITHRYLYDEQNRLMVAIANLPNGKTKTEYLVYGSDSVCGFAFDAWGTLVGVSEELYEGDRIRSYFCGSCFNHEADHLDFGITDFHYEAYYYSGETLQEVDYFFSQVGLQGVDDLEEIDAVLQGNKYYLSQSEGKSADFYVV